MHQDTSIRPDASAGSDIMSPTAEWQNSLSGAPLHTHNPQMYQLNKLQTERIDKGSLTHGGGTTIHRHKTRREAEIQRGTPETHNSQTPRTHNSQTPRTHNSQTPETHNLHTAA